MRKTKTSFYFFAIISVLLFAACNDAATVTETKTIDSATAVTKSETPSVPAYDPALDPLTVGAQFSKLLKDTLNIKMYEFTLKPGDSAAFHTHPDHTVYVLQGGKASISFNGAAPVVMDLVSGTGFISGAVSDAGKNIGTTTIKLVVTDIYRPRDK